MDSEGETIGGKQRMKLGGARGARGAGRSIEKVSNQDEGDKGCETRTKKKLLPSSKQYEPLPNDQSSRADVSTPRFSFTDSNHIKFGSNYLL